MISEKEIKELISQTNKEAKQRFKNDSKLDHVFYNLKAYLQAQKQTEDLINMVNTKILESGYTSIICELGKDKIKLSVDGKSLPEIKKHFDFSNKELYYAALDYYSQLYTEGDFVVSVIFLNNKETAADIHISLY